MDSSPSLGSILHLHYYYPPIPAVGSFRNYFISKHLSRFFSDSFLLTTTNQRHFRQSDFNTNHIRIEEVPTYDLRAMAWQNAHQNNASLPAHLKSSTLARVLRPLSSSFPTNLLFDDGNISYIFQAYQKACHLITAHQITHLYSSYSPIADHWIAYLLVKKFPHLYWIADFRDLLITPGLTKAYAPKLQWKVLSYLLQKADLCTTVSEGLATVLTAYHRDVQVIYNGFEQLSPPQEKLFPKFTISYIGSLYPSRQSAELLFNAVRELSDEKLIDPSCFQLRYSGKDIMIWNRWIRAYGLDDFSHASAAVSFTEAKNIASRSHINLLLSWTSPNQRGVLTAKLFTYLQAQRPIISLINGGRDEELLSILEQGTSSFCYSENIGGVKEFVKKTMRNPMPIRPLDIHSFLWENQVNKLVDKLRS